MSATPSAGIAPGFESAEYFTSAQDEYAALRNGAALVDRSARLRMIVSGAQAVETITGLVTNDVGALRPGAGQYAAALTVKGKLIADLRIFARGDDLLIDTPASAADGFSAMMKKFVNPRLARYSDVSATLRSVGVFGPRSHEVLSAVLATAGASPISIAAVRSLANYHHVAFDADGANIMVARVPDFGVEGYDLFLPVEAAEEYWLKLLQSGATPAGREATEIARVEVGRPMYGIDMDENTLAQEANFDALEGISYTKGCYTGQETVARVHFRGHVNRTIRGVQSAAPIPPRAELFDGDKSVGDVRSCVVSPRLGPIALAMLRREVETGAELIARSELREEIVHVRELPFAH